MKNQIVTRAIVLSRVDFREADRILTLLTLDHGKVSVIAKGVRRARSKLAGGIELLSVSEVTILPGRGEISTLVSSRLARHFGNIVKDINRTMFAYEALKRVHKLTEDAVDDTYFKLLERTFEGLDDRSLPQDLCELWFAMHLLELNGHIPNLKTDSQGKTLEQGYQFNFDIDSMSFYSQEEGPYTAQHIKLMRLCRSVDNPVRLNNVGGADKVATESLKLAKLLHLEHST